MENHSICQHFLPRRILLLTTLSAHSIHVLLLKYCLYSVSFIWQLNCSHMVSLCFNSLKQMLMYSKLASLNHHADSTLFKGNKCGPIAASMNESMFLLLFSKWQYAYDGLKETKDYKFVSAAGSLMKIMVVCTCFIFYVSIWYFLHHFQLAIYVHGFS